MHSLHLEPQGSCDQKQGRQEDNETIQSRLLKQQDVVGKDQRLSPCLPVTNKVSLGKALMLFEL